MYDLVIRGGTVVDGSGSAGIRADVGSETGASSRSAGSTSAGARRSTPRATSSRPASSTGTPTWMPRSSGTRSAARSCWHGVTTVVMGNCGFTLAPARAERAGAGRPQPGAGRGHLGRGAWPRGSTWTWETFPEYLDAVDRPAQGHQLRGQRRPLGPADLGDGRAGVRGGGHRGRPGRAWTASSARPSTPAPSGSPRPGATTTRPPTTGRWPRRLASWAEVVGLVSEYGPAAGPACSRSPASRRPAPTTPRPGRVRRPAARPGRGDRRAGHVRRPGVVDSGSKPSR